MLRGKPTARPHLHKHLVYRVHKRVKMLLVKLRMLTHLPPTVQVGGAVWRHVRNEISWNRVETTCLLTFDHTWANTFALAYQDHWAALRQLRQLQKCSNHSAQHNKIPKLTIHLPLTVKENRALSSSPSSSSISGDQEPRLQRLFPQRFPVQRSDEELW